MKKILCYIKVPIFNSVLFLLIINPNCFAAGKNPELSIVTDKTFGVSVSHGFTKLTDALKAKNITFEKVGSISAAKGKSIIVTGLSSGEALRRKC